MVLGIGIDIVQLSRFHHLLKKHGLQSVFALRLASRVLHHTELKRFQKFQFSDDIEQCVRLISGSWAAKEAVYKTLDGPEQARFEFKLWYRYQIKGKPYVWSDEYGKPEEFLHSTSHDGGVLVATVLRQERKNRE